MRLFTSIFGLSLSVYVCTGVFCANTSAQTQMPPERRELQSLTPQEGAALRDLLVGADPYLAYLRDQHQACDCHGNDDQDVFFLPYHRRDLQLLEDYLQIRLPKWSPNTCIPDSFRGPS